MSVELVTRVTPFATLLARTVADRLRTTCLPPGPTVSIDRVDVDVHGATVTATSDHAEVQVPVVAHALTEAALLAAPNGTPATLPVPATLVLSAATALTAEDDVSPGARVVLRAEPLAGTGDAYDTVNQAVAEIPAVTTNLAPLFHAFGLPLPSAASTTLVGDELAFRFGPTARAPRLVLGVDHGLFLSQDTVMAVLREALLAQIPDDVRSQVVLTGGWEPDGTVPRAYLEPRMPFSKDAHIPVIGDVPLNGVAWLTTHTTLSLTADHSAIHASTTWTVHVDLVGLPGIAESIAEASMADQIRGWFGTGDGDGDSGTFEHDLALPSVRFGGATAQATGLVASPAGMLVALLLPTYYPPIKPLTVESGVLSGPSRILLCSVVGEGPNPPLPVDQAVSVARAQLLGAGWLCSVRLVSAIELKTSVIARYDASRDAAVIDVRIPYPEALTATGPLQVIVRTPRGTRLLDMGFAPHVEVDGDGNVTNASMNGKLFDCVRVSNDNPYRAVWGYLMDGSVHRLPVDVYKPRPLEEKGWVSFVGDNLAISVQVVTLRGLEPGELVAFRSDTHAVAVTAGPDGFAHVPVVLAGGRGPTSEAVLERVTRGRVRPARVAVAAFEVVPTGLASVNPQPLPLEPRPDREPGVDWELTASRRPEAARELAGARELLGNAVVDVLPLPGLEAAPIRVAVLADGEGRVLQLDGTVPIRVTGTFSGPLGRAIGPDDGAGFALRRVGAKDWQQARLAAVR